MTDITSKAGSQRCKIWLILNMYIIEPQINEVILKQNDEWLYFSNPHRVIEIHALDAVVPVMQMIENLVNDNGWHAAGFVSYEAAPAFDKAFNVIHERRVAKTMGGFPFLWFGLYPAPRLISLSEPFDQTQDMPASPNQAISWSSTVSRDTYNAAIDQIKDHIASGRTYQVNYTMRLQASRSDWQSDRPWNFFLHLAKTQNNHAAYIDTGRYVIASASPELFFQLDGDTITSRPMKGTVKRGRTTLEDKEQAEWLHNSEKNRAENVMIVDMIRNDMGRIARIGSVHVPELFTVEKYPTLWQMTSTVKARTSVSIMNIFEALFPCASITGAPKISTMRIISGLETTPRKIYTGSIGYISPKRKASFNVAIRTALIDRETQTAEYGAGGGIVWDSISTDEYAEALLKARILTESPPQFSLLETMLWTSEEGFFLREKHIARLLDSSEYFDFPISSKPRWSSSPNRVRAYRDHWIQEKNKSNQWSRYVLPTNGDATRPAVQNEIIETFLDEISSQFTSPQRVKLLLDKNGDLSHEAKPFHPMILEPSSPAAENPLKVHLAKKTIDSRNVFLFHKTTYRDMYDSARSDFPNYDDTLLYNENDELTEFTIGNLVAEMAGKRYTPPISCGLLAGTFRAHLLETGQVEERIIRVDEIERCERVYRVNSVRGWERVELIPWQPA
jgi:para-aminobenzoate synthetase / 4-amino-4-deoxychorismate lyase